MAERRFSEQSIVEEKGPLITLPGNFKTETLYIFLKIRINENIIIMNSALYLHK